MHPNEVTLAGRPDPQRQRTRPRNLNRQGDVSDVEFPVALRGYDRQAVDEYVERVNRLIAQLRATGSAEGAVKEALDQVGEETSGILQRAHETADRITATAEAEARQELDAAARESDEMRSAAEERARRLAADTVGVWEDRNALIDDMRRLAESLLDVADTAAERLPEPHEIEAAHPVEAVDPADEEYDEDGEDLGDGPQPAEGTSPPAFDGYERSGLDFPPFGESALRRPPLERIEGGEQSSPPPPPPPPGLITAKRIPPPPPPPAAAHRPAIVDHRPTEQMQALSLDDDERTRGRLGARGSTQAADFLARWRR